MRQKLKLFLIALGFVLTISLVPALMIGTEYYLAQQHTPPTGATLQTLDKWCPNRTAEVEILIDGEKLLVVFGASPLFPITEFPPGYVFNESGSLIAWSPEASNTDLNCRYWDLAMDAVIQEDELRRIPSP